MAAHQTMPVTVTSRPLLAALGPLPVAWLIEYMQLENNILLQLQQQYYYGQSTVSDETYDRMFRELQALEAEFPELKIPNSVTSKVGG